MSIKSQIQILYLFEEYELEIQKKSVLGISLQIWSKDNQKPEEIFPEQSNNSDHLSMHEPSKNTGQFMLEIKYQGVGIIRGFTPGQDHPRYGAAVCALFGGTVRT